MDKVELARFLWTMIIAKIRSQNKIVLVVASFGIATLLLSGGRIALVNCKRCFETLYNLRDVVKGCFDDFPFGGKPILFGGDFRQNSACCSKLKYDRCWNFIDKFLALALFNCFFSSKKKKNMRLLTTCLNDNEKQDKWFCELDIGNGNTARSIFSADKESS